MARSVKYGVIGLVVVLIAVLTIVPLLKRTFPQYYDGFQDLGTDLRVQALLARGQKDSAHPDCVGVTCAEGQFCQRNTCIPIYPGPGST